jgi:EAL and modified HD-GYP domain-containing signal transduction protein
MSDLNPATPGRDVTDVALVAKQPVFDLQGAVWGYELLFRDPSMAPGLGNKSAQAATSTVMIDGFSLLRPMLRGKQRFLINFTAEFLEQELPQVLPPEICVIEILETVEPTKSVLQGLASLKQQGYLLAVDDYIGQDSLHPFLPLVDIVKVDILELGQNAQIAKIANDLKAYKAMLLAEKVEDHETASFCREQGFSLFQGFFYSKPVVVRGIKLNSSQLTKTRLLALMADKNVDFQQVNDILSTDVALTYRLLNYINSVYFGLPVKVWDVGHAAKLLGMQKLRQWLFVSALAGLDSSPMSREIVYISAYRAKFLETLAQSVGRNDKGLCSKLFLVGLFSMLESLMGVPAEEIFAQLSLEPEVQEVLVGGTGPLALWYDIMVAYEQGLWNEVYALAKTMNISDKQLSKAYIAADQWATEACSPQPSG